MRNAARAALAGSVLAGALFPGQGGVAGNAPPPARTVVIENVQFNPAALTVHRGERIVWVNKDLFPHTVTSPSLGVDSGSIAPQASWSFVPRKAGTYPYTCTFHPTMKATLTVQ